jgi:hypothetical protein
MVQGQTEHKVKSTSQPINWVWWYIAVIPAMLEDIGRRTAVVPQALSQK